MSQMPETLFEKSKKSKMSGMSLMPETLLKNLRNKNVRDVTAARDSF